MLIWLPLAGLVALLALAALIDLRERRIPNWLTGGVAALYPVYVLVSPMPIGLARRPGRRLPRCSCSASSCSPGS